MRPLTEDETRTLFAKLAKYVGKNITQLLERKDEPYCFRLHRDRVYYVSEALMRRAVSISRRQLCALGTNLGKFSKTGKFRVSVLALDLLAQFATHRVWVKPNGEMPFLYGNHVLRAHIGRMSDEATPENTGVVVFNMNDVPLGFGVMARCVAAARKADPTTIVVFHQADVGEYIRSIEEEQS